MKKIIPGLLALVVLISSCSKGKDVSPNSAIAEVAKPAAAFVINNPASSTMITEDRILDFDNKSANGDFYYWDFGNGKYSTEKVPTNISFAPCGTIATITLTVKNNHGDVSTTSQTFTVLCKGKHVQQ